MRQPKQLGFEILERNSLKSFGGAYLTSHPKEKRPLSVKKPSHLVMRSLYAKGPKSFLNFNKKIESIIHKQGKKFGVKVYRLANGGNHLHLVILPRSRKAFNSFIRSITGLIARLVLGSQRGLGVQTGLEEQGGLGAQKSLGAQRGLGAQQLRKIQFWEKRPFTRILEWGRDYKNVCDYLFQNTLEALGFIKYHPRKTRFNPVSIRRSALAPNRPIPRNTT